MHGGGRIGVVGARDADLGLVAEHRFAAGQADAFHLDAVGVGDGFGQPFGEQLLDLGLLGVGDAALAHTLSQAGQGVEALEQGEQLLVVGAGARQVERGGVLVDEPAALHDRLDQGAGAWSAGVGRPGSGRRVLGFARGRGARRQSALAGSRLVKTQQKGRVDAGHGRSLTYGRTSSRAVSRERGLRGVRRWPIQAAIIRPSTRTALAFSRRACQSGLRMPSSTTSRRWPALSTWPRR